MATQQLLLPNGLRADLYFWDDPKNISRMNICAPGLPNYPQKTFFETLPDNLRKEAFLVVHYYGYWHSSGHLSVNGTADSIVDVFHALCQGTARNVVDNELFPPYEKSIRFIGYSFGANPLARALNKIPQNKIDQIIFVAPLLLINRKDLANVDQQNLTSFYEYNSTFIDYVIDNCFDTIRLISEKEWQGYFLGVHPESAVSIPNELRDIIQIHYGEHDTLIPPAIIPICNAAVGNQNITTHKGIGHSKTLIVKALLSNQ